MKKYEVYWEKNVAGYSEVEASSVHEAILKFNAYPKGFASIEVTKGVECEYGKDPEVLEVTTELFEDVEDEL